MDLRAAAILAITCIVFTVCEAEVAIRWHKPEATWETLDKGETFFMRCIASGLSGAELVTLRRSSESDPKGYKVVSTKHVIEYPFKDRKLASGKRRYEARYERTDDEGGVLEVTILDMQAEDAGEFYCNVQVDNNMQIKTDTRTVVVNEPVNRVFWTLIGENGKLQATSTGQPTIGLTEGVHGGAACVVEMTSEVAVPVITISAPEVVSEAFVKSPVKEVKSADGHSVFQHVMRYETEEPYYGLNGKTLTCEAFTEGLEEQKRNSTALVAVEYKPVVDCGDQSPTAVDGGNGKVTCHIWSNPRADRVAISFGADLSDNVHEIPEGDNTVQNYTFTRMDSDDKTTVTFRIKGMKPEHFDDYKYQLTATSNQYGSATQDFSFERQSANRSPSFYSMTSSLLTVVIAIMLTLSMVR